MPKRLRVRALTEAERAEMGRLAHSRTALARLVKLVLLSKTLHAQATSSHSRCGPTWRNSPPSAKTSAGVAL